MVGDRSARPLLVVDLAVPRDIDPAVGGLPGVALHDIDMLEAVVHRNRSVRDGEAVEGEEIVVGPRRRVPALADVARRRAGHHGAARPGRGDPP